jgi:hypothetical protein
MHHVLVSTTAAIELPPRPRAAADWAADARWHRRMYAQSRFRWVTEDAIGIATRFVRGRLEFTTTRHLTVLEESLGRLMTHADQIRLAMAGPLREVRTTYGPGWGEALEVVDVSELDARIIIWSAVGARPHALTNADVQRAVRGLPLPNPLTEVWELRQVHGMYLAAQAVLEDTFCDLVGELTARSSLEVLAPLTTSGSARQLQLRITEQREARGGPDDPRRRPEQRY